MGRSGLARAAAALVAVTCGVATIVGRGNQPAGDLPSRFTADVTVCARDVCGGLFEEPAAYRAAFDLTVERWTAPAEAARLANDLAQQGWHAFVTTLAARPPAGFLHEFRHEPRGFRQVYPLQLAVTRPAPGGRRHVRLVAVYEEDDVRCVSLDLDGTGGGIGIIEVALALAPVEGDMPFWCAGVDRRATLDHVRAWPAGR
jgi:hypothetical protein